MKINELTNTDLLLENHTINKIDCLLGLLYKHNFDKEFTSKINFGILTQMTYQKDDVSFVVKPSFEQGFINITFSNDTSWNVNFALIDGKPKYIGYTDQEVTIEEPHSREYYTLTSESIRQLTIQVLINTWYQVNNIPSEVYEYQHHWKLDKNILNDDDIIRYYYRFILATYWGMPTPDRQATFEKWLENDIANGEGDDTTNSHLKWLFKQDHSNITETTNVRDEINACSIHHIYPSGNITCVLTDNKKPTRWREYVMHAFYKTIGYTWVNPIELYWHKGTSVEYVSLETVNANLLLAANIFTVYSNWNITENSHTSDNSVSIPAINLFCINSENSQYAVSFKNKNNNSYELFDSLSLSGNQIISYTGTAIEKSNCSGPLKFVSDHVIKFICKELTTCR
ncbi:hypothetical protein KEN49_CDS0413 [Pseudomonas phage vB_Pae3705-KEN49]